MTTFEVNQEAVKLANELLGIGRIYIGISRFSLLSFSKKMGKLKNGEIHAGDMILPLISKLRKKIRNSERLHDMDKDRYLFIIERIEREYYQSLSTKHLANQGRGI